MKKQPYTEVSEKDQKKFQKYLSEDEELIVATGLGRHYLRQKLILQIIIPWGILIIASLAYAYFNQLNLGYALLFGLFLAILCASLQTLLIYHSNRYLLTTRRVIIKKGFLNVRLTTALFDKITHIEVDQGFIDRMVLKHGVVVIHTAGSSKDEMVLKYIEEPLYFKNLLEKLIHRERMFFSHKEAKEAVETVEGELIT